MDNFRVEILSFYEFKTLGEPDDLSVIKASLRSAMVDHHVRGTILLAREGYNGMVCGSSSDLQNFVRAIEKALDTHIAAKSSFAETAPFRKTDVRVKPEIVTLKRAVKMSLGAGTHVEPRHWNRLISDPETLVLDTRNDYEFRTGTFKGAVNPEISKFSELPDFVASRLNPFRHKRVAMFCTGGIRCEKFAPYMKSLGFPEVFQLEGGILKYLEEVPQNESLWQGECFVFDERVAVDVSLSKGTAPDLSQRHLHDKKRASGHK